MKEVTPNQHNTQHLSGGEQWWREDIVNAGARALGQELLSLLDVDAVVVCGVEDGGRGGRYPCRVGTSLGVGNLLHQHVGHGVRRRPHALANLRPAREARFAANVDVPVLVGPQPLGRLDARLDVHRARW